MDIKENNVEWIGGAKTVTATISDAPMVRRIKKFYDANASDFLSWYENKNGSITFRVSKKWLKLTPPRKSSREYTDEERAALAERLSKIRKKKGGETTSENTV